ncbi:hypothetical protein LZ32DRAFT_96170 [Colletotrichum eremochloae]|nr:hypothetical protein LZ32DRAFT_96170 [Colletotrichum eremochloae]
MVLDVSLPRPFFAAPCLGRGLSTQSAASGSTKQLITGLNPPMLSEPFFFLYPTQIALLAYAVIHSSMILYMFRFSGDGTGNRLFPPESVTRLSNTKDNHLSSIWMPTRVHMIFLYIFTSSISNCPPPLRREAT